MEKNRRLTTSSAPRRASAQMKELPPSAPLSDASGVPLSTTSTPVILTSKPSLLGTSGSTSRRSASSTYTNGGTGYQRHYSNTTGSSGVSSSQQGASVVSSSRFRPSQLVMDLRTSSSSSSPYWDALGGQLHGVPPPLTSAQTKTAPLSSSMSSTSKGTGHRFHTITASSVSSNMLGRPQRLTQDDYENRPKQTWSSSVIATHKQETSRWVAGVMVRDKSTQTATTDFKPSESNYVEWKTTLTVEDDDDTLLNDILNACEPSPATFDRCPGPDADMMLRSGRFGPTQDDRRVSSYPRILTSSLPVYQEPPQLTAVPPAGVLIPRPTKMMSQPVMVPVTPRIVWTPPVQTPIQRPVPGTPLSERSVSTSSEDGSSSVSSYSTLPSSISSPDSTKVACIGGYAAEKSAFSANFNAAKGITTGPTGHKYPAY
ncbi:hypothetical protein HDV05_001300 [Chytridiales sp. JEL 0842]|nr:hypothetical protein HDV05_001300 [Chytridiales sp. JEL 0842]